MFLKITGMSIVTHEPPGGAAVPFCVDCGSLNRITYSQSRRKVEGEMKGAQSRV